MKYKLYTSVLLLFACYLCSAQSGQKSTPILKTTIVDTIIKNLMQGDSSKFVPKVNLKLIKKNAHASYYADKFTGRRTASGKKFNNNHYTAAHRKLPFGTKVKVTNESNGKSVIVVITDRGPFVKGRDIDLTKRAFMEIASKRYGGSLKVTMEEVLK